MKWISVKDKMPQEGKYILARHNRGTWHDSTDQDNVNCVVVKLARGISKKERQTLIELNHVSANYFKACDEHGNNLVPYNWKSFGVDSFFGQDITHWMEIPKLTDES